MSAPNAENSGVTPMEDVGGNPANTIYVGNLDQR